MFSYETFIVLAFTFKSLIHLESIPVYGVRQVLYSLFYMCFCHLFKPLSLIISIILLFQCFVQAP